jgi:ribosomal protein L40E
MRRPAPIPVPYCSYLLQNEPDSQAGNFRLELIGKEIIMANVCAKCGAELTPNVQSCSSCGAAAAAQPAVAQFIGEPPTSGSSTLKIVLIVVAVIIGLGILVIGALGFIGYRIAKNVHVDPSGRMTMNTPAGTITTTPVDNVTEADLGVEIYPGAQSTQGSMKMEMPNGSGVTGAFLTSDSPAQVLAFYKDKLGSAATVISFLGSTTMRLTISRQESIQVMIRANSKLDNGKTRIMISHTKITKAP